MTRTKRIVIFTAIIFSVAFWGFSFSPKLSCYSCNSTGIVTCGKCSGNGQIRKRIQDRDNRRNRQPRFTTVRCFTCNGTGKVVCSVCKGASTHHSKSHKDFPPHREKQTCVTCNGRGNVQCEVCEGSLRGAGKLSCSGCGGRGYRSYNAYTREYNDCMTCSGKGERECYGCSGTGRTDCEKCNGMGRFDR